LYLEVKHLTVLYDRAVVLNDVSLHVDSGEIVSLLGPNGAGKSTFLRAVAGLTKWEINALRGTVHGKITLEGSVIFDGEEILNLPPNEIVKRGLSLCPERGRPFREMTIEENLATGGYLAKDKRIKKESLENVYNLFPLLKAREKQIAGSLSGGERSMLAIGRALMSQARLLLIDEPSVGLAPMVNQDLFERIRDVHGLGITILLSEQDISFAFDLAVRNYVLSQGNIMAAGTAESIMGDDLIKKTYLGL
jgi:branched-chain amino acid transport system ATP-binding protein